MPYLITTADVTLAPQSSGFEVWGSTVPESRTFAVLGRQPENQPLSGDTFSTSCPVETPWDPYRYLRLVKSSPQPGVLSLKAFRVRGRWIPPVNIATGKPAEASSGQGSVGCGNDGRPETAWRSDPGDSEPWWQVDLGEPVEVR